MVFDAAAVFDPFSRRGGPWRAGRRGLLRWSDARRRGRRAEIRVRSRRAERRGAGRTAAARGNAAARSAEGADGSGFRFAAPCSPVWREAVHEGEGSGDEIAGSDGGTRSGGRGGGGRPLGLVTVPAAARHSAPLPWQFFAHPRAGAVPCFPISSRLPCFPFLGFPFRLLVFRSGTRSLVARTCRTFRAHGAAPRRTLILRDRHRSSTMCGWRLS